VVAGDSAGGHLALSLLVDLDKKRSSSANDKVLCKPGGLMLMSPWLSLHHEPAWYARNAPPDVLSGLFIHQCARRFLGHNAIVNESSKDLDKCSPYLEFLLPEPGIEWEVVLSSWLWVSAGGNEIFFDDIETWVRPVRERLGEQKVRFDVGFGKLHVWQWLETMMDESMKKLFLGNAIGDRRGFDATANIGRAIVAQMKWKRANAN